MAASSSAGLSRDIQTLFEDGTAVGLTDRQLLDRFAGHRDPTAAAAFEALVRRHGPMVLRVCRNALSDPNDAQDAFQATFLVLVRRCRALKGLDSLGGWLYGVACRVSARARVEAARRRAVEQRAALRVVEAVEPAGAEEMDRDEFGPIVQEEVRRLPEKYRAAVVLCYWEGLTQEQAAAQLGCPLGTVRSRLARARDLLRRRLTRRGVAPIAVGVDAATGSIRKLPPLAPKFVQATVQAAARVAAGQATNQVVSGLVTSLVQGILWRTTMIKLGGIAAGVILVGLAGYGAGIAAQRTGDAGVARRASDDEPKPTADRGRPTAKTQETVPVQYPSREKVVGDASSKRPVYSTVEGEARIVKIAPNRAYVKKGDVVCELDSAPFRDQLVNQRIAVKTAEAAYTNAKLAREVAEIAVREYLEGHYVERLQDVEGNIKLAEAELSLAELEFQAAKAEPRSGMLAIKRAEVNLLRARFSLEKTQSRMNVLQKYTHEKTVKELNSAVKKGQAEELVKQATWELERIKEKNLERQVLKCTITAPVNGRLHYATVDTHNGFVLQIEEGVAVRERQVLFSIEPLP
jgi:RNA polymerase sigma factor (sigma-70 family)